MERPIERTICIGIGAALCATALFTAAQKSETETSPIAAAPNLAEYTQTCVARNIAETNQLNADMISINRTSINACIAQEHENDKGGEQVNRIIGTGLRGIFGASFLVNGLFGLSGRPWRLKRSELEPTL